jgi:hypothetical protein
MGFPEASNGRSMRVLLVLLALSGTAYAEAKPVSCVAELEARKISFKPARAAGIAHAVEITGPVGGVTYTGHAPLVIDCSLAISLDEVGRYLRALGITSATWSSAYSIRNVRGTTTPSKHSYGLAIDIHSFAGKETLSVERDYERDLGDDLDCVGQPVTQSGTVLKILQCQLVRSGLFSLVLSPDYDADHADHFHLEVRAWRVRTELRSPMPAIH